MNFNLDQACEYIWDSCDPLTVITHDTEREETAHAQHEHRDFTEMSAAVTES